MSLRTPKGASILNGHGLNVEVSSQCGFKDKMYLGATRQVSSLERARAHLQGGARILNHDRG